MADRSHLSIGEVLSLLRDEFPDVTISKIRFLESQGLVDPERTPSGYRKFYDHDVDRLRWILLQQRENFLPLKVIRGRLTGQGEDSGELDPDGDMLSAEEGPVEVQTGGDPTATSDSGPAPEPPIAEAVGAGAPANARPSALPATESGRPRRPALVTPSLFAQEATAQPAAAKGSAAKSASSTGRRNLPAEDAESFTADELAAASDCTPALIDELRQFGLINPHAVVAGTPYFDDCALAITRAAAEFGRHGVEVRHLRAWRNAADREASLFEQIVLPMLRQRNPQARRQAADTLAFLSRLGGDLRAALVDQAVRDIK